MHSNESACRKSRFLGLDHVFNDERTDCSSADIVEVSTRNPWAISISDSATNNSSSSGLRKVDLHTLFVIIDIWSTSLNFDLYTSIFFILFCNFLMFMHCSERQIFLRWLVIVCLGIPYVAFISSYDSFINTLASHAVISSDYVYNVLPCCTYSIYWDHLVIWISLIVSTNGFFPFLILICWWDSNLVSRFWLSWSGTRSWSRRTLWSKY